MSKQGEVLKELDTVIKKLEDKPWTQLEGEFQIVVLKALRHIVETVY